jgi:calcineurin-like phosphoesterase family protein
MSDTFITSDEHYGHRFIMEACNRPFASVEEMTETLIERHNKKVPNKKSYLTIHAGDMFWRTLSEDEAAGILARLHGRHAFLFGNHDELMALADSKGLLRSQFEWVRGENKENTSHSIKFNGHRLVISHFAQRVWQSSHKGSWHVYGHSHGGLPAHGKSFDIGVDCNNLEPWSLEEIAAKMETLESAHIECPSCKERWELARIKRDILREASVAQSAERRTCNADVGGSIPSAGSKFDLAEYFENLARREEG